MADEIKKEGEVVIPKEDKPADAPAAAAGEGKGDEGRDYKAENEELKKQLGQAEHTIVVLKKGKKEAQEGATKEDEGGGDNDPSQVVKQELEKFKVEQSQEILEDELSKLTDNPDKKELIRTTYMGKIVKGGFTRASIQADLMSALAIVDRPRQQKTIDELKKKNISDMTKNRSGSAAGQDIKSNSGGITEDMLTPKDRVIMARHGLTLEDINKGIKK